VKSGLNDLSRAVHGSIASERMSQVHTTAITAVNETAPPPRAGRRLPRLPRGPRAMPPRRLRGALGPRPGAYTVAHTRVRIMPF